MTKFFLAWLTIITLTFPSIMFGALPPTRSGGQSDTLSTTFDFRAPYSQVTKTSGTAGLFETGSYQLLKNPSFEATTYSSNWTASGGTLAAATSTNIFYGKSATWDSSGAAQTLTSDAITVPEGFKGNNCEASIYIKVPSGTATHTLEAWDGTNVLATATIVNSVYFTKNTVTFPCPTSGTIALRLVSVASDEPLIALDEAYLGLARNVGTVAQAVFKGSVSMTGCTDWTRSNGTFDNFTATSGCTYSATGDVLAPSTVIPGFRLQNVAPGRYLVIARGFFGKNISTTNADASFRFSDGTTTFSEQVAIGAATSSGLSAGVGEISGAVTYTSGQSTLTIQVQGKVSSTASSTAALVRDDGGANAGTQIDGLTFEVYYYPTSAQTVIMPDAQGWWAGATFESSTSVDLGTTSAAKNEIDQGDITLTPDSGSAPIGIVCASGNASPIGGTTCSAGNEVMGATVNIPRAGQYDVCFSAVNYIRDNGAATNISVVNNFQMDYTSPTSDTAIVAGVRNTTPIFQTASSGGAEMVASGFPFSHCETFSLPVGQVAFRMKHSSTISGTVTNNNLQPNSGQSRISIRPVTSQQQALLANSVSTKYQTGVTEETAIVTCSSSSGIDRQLGTWVSSVGNISSGVCAITVNGFGGTPYCDVNGWGTGISNVIVRAYCSSSTACEISGYNTATGLAATAFTAKFSCKAQR